VGGEASFLPPCSLLRPRVGRCSLLLLLLLSLCAVVSKAAWATGKNEARMPSLVPFLFDHGTKRSRKCVCLPLLHSRAPFPSCSLLALA
jgi:hypothetical protein